MFLILKIFLGMAHETFVSDKAIDPRMKDYPLVSSPWPGLCILVAYLLFVLKIGPAFMKNRKPYNLKLVICLYNLCQVLLNLRIFMMIMYGMIMSENFSLMCQTSDSSIVDPHMQILLKAMSLYYLSKYADLLDSIFFTLRKKTSQLSFLHLYHHTFLIILSYLIMRYYAGSHVMLSGMMNALVHVIMYFYYFLTSYNPELAKQLWWKKYLTLLQIIQFVIIFCHFVLPLLQPSCKLPRTICFIGLTLTASMTAMFSDFYIGAYVRAKKEAPKLQ